MRRASQPAKIIGDYIKHVNPLHIRRLVVKKCNAVATDEEQAFLKSSESEYGERLRMVTNLTDLVLKRTAKILEGHGMSKLPKMLQPPNKKSAGVKRKAPTISFFENTRYSFVKHCTETKTCSDAQANGMFTDPDRATVQQWRIASERGGAGPIVAPPVLPPTVASQEGVMSALLRSWQKK